MITAEEAHAETEKVIDGARHELRQKLMEDIEQAIKDAIAQGKYSTSYPVPKEDWNYVNNRMMEAGYFTYRQPLNPTTRTMLFEW